MAINYNKPHLSKIEVYASGEQYIYPSNVNIGFPIKSRNRAEQGHRILSQLNEIRQKFNPTCIFLPEKL